jgi:hypothetical protein
MTGVFLASTAAAATGQEWKAGVASVKINPEGSIWMAGYGSRTKPSEGQLHHLWAKALAVAGPAGKSAVLVSLDICGIGRPLSNEIRQALEAKYHLKKDQVTLACSHTHSGPVVATNLITMYPMSASERERTRVYATQLRDSVVDVVGKALGALQPARLSWATGRCDFAVNRRDNDEKRVDDLRSGLALKGPVDHDVPVLAIEDTRRNLRAVVYGYACHCTTLQGYQLSNDWAGFASLAIEKLHPGVTALFVAGCGADQNPLPRRTVELAQKYGQTMAAAVEDVLKSPLRPITGALATAYEEIDLALGEIPDKPHWEQEAKSATPAVAERAKMLLRQIESQGSLQATYPYPVQIWRLGNGPLWIMLGGEVVVDYSSRLKRNLGSSRTWVSAYCNDVMAYIPSLRVLKEGGYEGATSMIYYGLPAPWSERVEDQVIGAVRKLSAELPANGK